MTHEKDGDDRGFDRARVAAAGGHPTTAGPMVHRTDSVAAPVQETSGTAAAEATGMTKVDNDAPPEATAGSG